jgi:hypothetical protein
MKRILNTKPEGGRKGRPELRWEDVVDNGVKVVGERNWKKAAKNR